MKNSKRNKKSIAGKRNRCRVKETRSKRIGRGGGRRHPLPGRSQIFPGRPLRARGKWGGKSPLSGDRARKAERQRREERDDNRQREAST